jgi:sugar phosphate isomerase/epimerase
MTGLGKFRYSYIFVDPPSMVFSSAAEFGRGLKRLRELGYGGVEMPLAQPLGFEVPQMQAAAAQAGLEFASLLTGWSYVYEGLALCSPDAKIRQDAVARLEDRVRIAAQLGAVVVVGQMQGLPKDEPDVAAGNARIAAGLQQVGRTAEALGVTLVLEAVDHLSIGFNTTLAEVEEMLRRVNSPAFKPMYDSFHANIEERSLTEPILRLGANLGHVHLCDTNGGPFGTGHLDFEAVMGALNDIHYGGWVSVKVYRYAPSWEAGAAGAMAYLQRLGAA